MKRYDSLNGIRAIACLGIALMHVKANLSYMVPGNILNLIVNELGNLTILFMVLSAFSMCCGYYDKIKNNKISIEDFYKKRFKKILPFFSFLVILGVIIEHNLSALIEGFADITLMFGFIQKDIQVLGVAWFLGLVFVFYMIFPFFVYLFFNKKRAWCTTIIAFIMNLTSVYYFDIGRKNMFYSFIFFCIGGLLYLYKDKIITTLKSKRVISFIVVIISILIYFLIPSNKYLFAIRILPMCIMLISYAISFDSKILNNKVTSFISNISLEIYLCHMVIFRVIEKLKLTHIVNNNLISYFITFGGVVIGSIILSYVFQMILKKIEIKEKTNESLISK